MDEYRKIEDLENILLEESKPYSEKLDSVVSAWKVYYERSSENECPDILHHALPVLYRVAVRIILHGDWPRLKHVTRRNFTSLIKRCTQYLSRKFPDSAKKCKSLTSLWVDPWDHPTLRQILEKATAPDEDVCAFIKHEGNELLFLRVEAMCDGKCEDLALQLVACYLKHLKQSSNCHDIVVDDMNDIFIALLYKFNKKQEVVDMLKAMPLSEGIQLIHRFSEKSTSNGRLWKHFDKMKFVACDSLLDVAMDMCMNQENDRCSLFDLINLWINWNVEPKMGLEDFIKPVSVVVRKLITTAGSARHIYIFTQAMTKKYGDRLKMLCIELYIRGLSLNMNEIEELKARGDEKLIQANKDLADGFLQLAELFSGNDSVCRECILSSFSLFPTKETLHRIQVILQVEDSSKNTSSNCDSRRLEKCSYHEQYNCTCSNNLLSIQLDPEILKLAPHLPDDLDTVLSRSRSKLLSWSLGKQLDRECQKYIKNFTLPEFKTQELQYLNIDYSQFKDWPKSKDESNEQLKGGSTTKSKNTAAKKGPIQKRKSDEKFKEKLSRKQNLKQTPPSKNSDLLKLDSVLSEATGIEKFESFSPPTDSLRPVKDELGLGLVGDVDSFKSFSPISYAKQEDTGTQTEVNRRHNPTPSKSDLQKSKTKLPSSKQNESNGPALLQINHITPSGRSANCTTPVSSSKLSKPAKHCYGNRKINAGNASCSSYLTTHSPTPAEVPPTALSDFRIQEKLKPILKSLDMNPKVVLEDILSVNRTHLTSRGFSGKPGLPDYRDNLDILAQAVMRSDILLAKSVPGMNSVDMIVPQPQETAVNVVQISNSIPVLSQPAVTTVGASSSLSQTIHTTNSANVVSMVQANNQTSQSRIKTADSSFQADCSTSTRVLETSKTQDQNNFSSTIDNNSSASLTPSNAALSETRTSTQSGTQTSIGRSVAKNSLSTSSDQFTLISEGPSTSQQEGPLVTAHIQRVGQPQKQRKPSEMPTSRATSTNPGQGFDEGSKVSSSQVFRLIVKDGRVVEQYYQGNQSLEPVLSIPDSEEIDTTLPTNVPNSYNHDHFIKLLKKKNDIKTKHVTKEVDNVQVSSLPKFHHVFGRQMYQSDSISLENSSMSSHTQYDERSSNPDVKVQRNVSTPGLSKAVQTIQKDSDSPIKTVDKQKAETHTTTSVLPQSSNAVVTLESKDVRHTNELPSSSGVIFTCKVPISIASSPLMQGKPVTILKTASGESIPCTKVVDSDSRSKDSVIRSGNMNALLAAALQSGTPIKHTVINNPPTTSMTVGNVKHIKVSSRDGIVMQKMRMPTPAPLQKTIRRQPALPPRYVRPLIQVSTGNSMTQTGPPVVTIPVPARTVVLATNVNQNAITSQSLTKIETCQDHLNAEQPSVSSTTLEQLREFESVLEQVTNTSQMKERGNVKKVEHQPTQTTSTDFSVAASKVNPIFQSSLVNTISELNNERVSLTFINKNVSSGSSTMVTSHSSKITTSTPVVVVQSCSRPLASPALSINSQSSLSPAPQTSPAHISSKIGTKVNKPKVKSVGKTAPTTTIKVSALPKPPQKPQEDEQTTQRIYAILDKYAEQLRNSPELKNKPAPRRRSNPPTNPTQSSKRKKSSHNKSKSVSSLPTCSGSEMSPGSEDLRTLGSEDSSNGVSQLSQVLNSPQSRNDEHSNPPGGDISSETSESLDAKDNRSQHRLVLTDSATGSGRTVLVQENIQPLINLDGSKVLAGKQLVVGSGATVPLTLSLPAGKQVIFPVPADGRPFVVAKVPKMYRVTMPTGSPLLATAGSGAVVLRQMCLNKGNSGVKQVKLPVVSQLPGQGMNTITSQPTVVLPSGSQSFTLATSSAIDGDSLGITLDNTILLNTTTSQSLGFFQRSVTKSVGSQQSPNLLATTTRASLDSENGVSQFSNTSELASGTKPGNTHSNHLTSAALDQMKPYNSISQHTNAIKNQELRFNVTSTAVYDKPQAGKTELIVSNAKTWSQMIDATKSDHCRNNEEHKTIHQIKVTEPDFHSIARPESNAESSLPSTEDQSLKTTSRNDGSVRTKMKDDPHFAEGRHSQEGVRAFAQQEGSEQWQFNLNKTERISKEIKTEATSPEPAKGSSGILLNNLNHSVGVKRKLSVDNTIVQVAFKRSSDKPKLVKDEFIPQRNVTSNLDREIRLQKSLSEECEDLGVDKPRTCELFPEAELLLDSDPLSRDSLQELYSRGMESSSSSHDSPLSCSPTVLNENSHSKFSSLPWKRQKNVTKAKSFDSSSKTLKLERLENKSDSSGDNSPINGGSEPPAISRVVHVKSTNCEPLDFKPAPLSKKESVPSGSRDQVISLDSDNCNLSDVDDSPADPQEGESDSDTHSSRKGEFSGIIEPVHDTRSSDKVNEYNISSSQKGHKCPYQVTKGESFKGKLETNLQWFDIEQEGHKVSGDASSKTNRDESPNDRSSLNWMLLDEWSNQREEESLVESNARRSRGGSSSFHRELGSPKTKRKKPTIFVSSSAGEDSGSSFDALLAGRTDELEMDSLSRRSSVRGRVKKGCPCFNGSLDSAKKKRDLCSGSFVKTDKPCVSKSVNVNMSPTKKLQKVSSKSPNRKR